MFNFNNKLIQLYIKLGIMGRFEDWGDRVKYVANGRTYYGTYKYPRYNNTWLPEGCRRFTINGADAFTLRNRLPLDPLTPFEALVDKIALLLKLRTR